MTHKLTRHETPKTAMLRVFGETALAFLPPLGIAASASARRALVAILAIATLAVIAACQTGGSAGLVQTVNAVDGLISFEGAKFNNLAARRLRFKDAWQTEEYVRFQGGGIQSELIYSVAVRHDYVSLEFPYTLDQTLRQWRFLGAGITETSRPRRTDIAGFDVRYKTFSLDGGALHCFGFTAEGPPKVGDPNGLPVEIVFGYFCDNSNRALTDEAVEDMIFSINVVAGRKVGTVTNGNTVPTTQDATQAGNVKFPLDLARYYQITSGSN